MSWRIVLCTITLYLAFSGKAQFLEQVGQYEQVLKEQHTAAGLYSKANVRKKYGTSPLNLVFRFYKRFVSSQDNNSCSFHPSCSVYAMECVKKKGIIKGTLSTFDRLARCYGLAPEYYTRHEGTLKLYDPVE
jgi:putative membrane protein insertion efficiency factor